MEEEFVSFSSGEFGLRTELLMLTDNSILLLAKSVPVNFVNSVCLLGEQGAV